MKKTFKLIEPTAALRDSFIQMVHEFQAHGETRYEQILSQLEKNFTGYVQQLKMQSEGIGLQEGHVSQTTWWSVKDDEIIGVIRIRHSLTPMLEKIGGHIGYQIRPSRRREGFGSRQLALALDLLREWDWEKVLITCDDDNTGSARIIESNGGVLWDVNEVDGEPKPIRRYWIHFS
jgi:predicted acetyltransferase